MLNEDLMTPYERLKASYKLYDEKQKKYIANLRMVIDRQTGEIERLKQEVASLKVALVNTEDQEYVAKLEEKVKQMRKECSSLNARLRAMPVMEELDDDKIALVNRCQTLKEQVARYRKRDKNQRETISELVCRLNKYGAACEIPDLNVGDE